MKVKLFISAALAAAIAVPVANGGATTRPAGGPGAGGPILAQDYLSYEPVGGPGAGGPILAQDYLGYEPVGGPGAGGPILASDYLGYQPAGGPGAAGPIVQPVAATVSGGDGFDWADAAVGGGFVAGLLAFGAGAARILRRRATLAHMQQ